MGKLPTKKSRTSNEDTEQGSGSQDPGPSTSHKMDEGQGVEQGTEMGDEELMELVSEIERDKEMDKGSEMEGDKDMNNEKEMEVEKGVERLEDDQGEERHIVNPNRLNDLDKFVEGYRTLVCPLCPNSLPHETHAALDEHLHQHHPDLFIFNEVPIETDNEQIEMVHDQNFHNNANRRYKAELDSVFEANVLKFFDRVSNSAHSVINNEMSELKNVLVIANLQVLFFHPGSGELQTGYFNSYNHAITNTEQFPWLWKFLTSKSDALVEEWTKLRSGWIIEHVQSFEMIICKYRPLFGSSYIPLPRELIGKRCLLNIDNSKETLDNSHEKCFLWSVLASDKLGGHLLKQKYKRIVNRHDKKPESYQKFTNLVNDRGINYPVTMSEIPKFEKLNPNISFTILGYEVVTTNDDEDPAAAARYQAHCDLEEGSDSCDESEKESDEEDLDYDSENCNNAESDSGESEPEASESNSYYGGLVRRKGRKNPKKKNFKKIKERTFVLYNSKVQKDIHIDLLLLIGKEKNHFVLIKDLGTYLSQPHQYKRRICRNCLQGFKTDRTLREHSDLCVNFKCQQVIFPKDGEIHFKNYDKTQKSAFRFYADFEALLPQCKDPLRVGQNETKLNIHKPCGFTWLVVDYNGKARYYNTYRSDNQNENVAERMVTEILNCTTLLANEIGILQEESKTNMIITEEDEVRLAKQTHCCLCKRKLNKQSVRHHAHLPPHNVIGLAHNECNLNARMDDKFTVQIHNGGAYDFHYLVKAVTNLKRNKVLESVDVIPNSTEKFMAMIINGNLTFLDSIRFTLEGLDKLVSNLKDSGVDKFKVTNQVFSEHDKFKCGDLKLLLKKGVYPYSYMTGVDKFKEQSLPPKEAFYDNLKEKDISEKDYKHALKVWESFQITTLGEYHDLYVTLDTCLLADVMEEQREILYSRYELELSHYLSLPMVAYDAALKISNVSLEYITDSTMHLFFENAVRGGFCGMGSLRTAKANNKYMGDQWDPTKKSTYLMFNDCTAQYSYCMTQHLPVRDFKWLRLEENERISEDPHKFIKSLEPDAETGYFLEVDISIPVEHHDLMNDYPPAPIRRNVTKDEISPHYQEHLKSTLGKSESSVHQTPKLITDLHNKTRYRAHYRALQAYIDMGCIISRVHRGVKFTQEPFLKKYIEFNTDMRNQAKNEFERAFWKLMNNSVFGKMIENKRNRQNVNIVTNEGSALRLNRKPTIQNIIPIDSETSIYLMKIKNVYLDRPLYVGVSILDIAKTLMYNYHYQFIKKVYGDKAKHLYSDTDSMLHLLETEDAYEDFSKNSEFLDMSVYDPCHPQFGKFHDEENKQVLGKFKDEYKNKVITEVVCIRPKLYSIAHLELPVEPEIESEDEPKTEPKPPKYILKFTKNQNFEMVEGKCKKKAKGITRTGLDKLKHSDFKNVLIEGSQRFVKMRGIQSKRHQLYTMEVNKLALCPLDTKRYYTDNINSLAFGHFKIPKVNQ